MIFLQYMGSETSIYPFSGGINAGTKNCEVTIVMYSLRGGNFPSNRHCLLSLDWFPAKFQTDTTKTF